MQVRAFDAQPPFVPVAVASRERIGQALGILKPQPFVGEACHSRGEGVDFARIHRRRFSR
ncbi:MAG: hypothetical protein HZY78_00655 [Burkholderiaceae bacterium]|nr:MAG: hypothetical protein HZY78_00655 [Burkholderiaceae bacterium]